MRVKLPLHSPLVLEQRQVLAGVQAPNVWRAERLRWVPALLRVVSLFCRMYAA